MNHTNFEQYISSQLSDVGMGETMFRTRIFVVSELMDMLVSGRLRLIDNYVSWSRDQKSAAIESVLMGLPPGSIIIDGSDHDWYVVEGAEILEAYLDFYNDGLSLTDVNFKMSDYAGMLFSQLPLKLISRFLNCEIVSIVVNPDTSDLCRLWIYNTSLIKSSNEDKLWKCAEVIYNRQFDELEHFAHKCNVRSLRNLWIMMLAIYYNDFFYSENLRRRAKFEDMNFNMFKCIALIRMYEMISDLSPDYTLFMDISYQINRILRRYSWWESDKRECFIIVVSLMIFDKREFRSEHILIFNDIWKENTYSGKLNLFSDYVTIVNEIYKKINI